MSAGTPRLPPKLSEGPAIAAYDQAKGVDTGGRKTTRLALGAEESTSPELGFLNVAYKVDEKLSLSNIIPQIYFKIQKTMHLYVPVTMKVQDGDEEVDKEIYVNVQSLANRLLLSKEEILNAVDSKQLAKLMCTRAASLSSASLHVGKSVKEAAKDVSAVALKMNRTIENIVALVRIIQKKDSAVEFEDKLLTLKGREIEVLKIGDELGKGSCGTAYKVENVMTGAISVIKKLKNPNCGDNESAVLEKLRLRGDLRGEGVLRQITDVKTGKTRAVEHIRMPIYKDDGMRVREKRLQELKTREFGVFPHVVRERHFAFKMQELFSFFSDIVGLQKNNIIHMDIKLENVACDEPGSMMACDFGGVIDLDDPDWVHQKWIATPFALTEGELGCIRDLHKISSAGTIFSKEIKTREDAIRIVREIGFVLGKDLIEDVRMANKIPEKQLINEMKMYVDGHKPECINSIKSIFVHLLNRESQYFGSNLVDEVDKFQNTADDDLMPYIKQHLEGLKLKYIEFAKRAQVFEMGTLAYDMLIDGADVNANRWPEDASAYIAHPQGGHASLVKKLKAGYPKNPDLMNFLGRMLDPTPSKRPSAEEAMNFMKTQLPKTQ